MRTPSHRAACCLAAALLAAAPAGACAQTARPGAATQSAAAPPTAEEVSRALARGTAFLLASQNADGSWGSARRTKDLNIYAPVPGAHRAFRAAVTSLCVWALIEAGGEAPEVRKSLDRGEAYLLEDLPELRRPAPAALYNNWAHAYGIRALVRMHARTGDPMRREEVLRQIARQVEFLKRFECLNGGWGYLDFGLQSQHSTTTNVSCTTATCLVALHEARSLGVHVPQELTDRAVASILRQRNPDFSYCYSEPFQYYRGRLVCRAPGSLGRSQACNLAMRLWGDRRVTDEVIKEWLQRLLDRNGWLSRARKMPVPHESWFAVAGYFFYYGHFYAAECIGQLPPRERGRFQDGLAGILVPLQEKDGSWWDYPMYDYHQGWGTAYAMLALKRCRREPEGSPRQGAPSTSLTEGSTGGSEVTCGPGS